MHQPCERSVRSQLLATPVIIIIIIIIITTTIIIIIVIIIIIIICRCLPARKRVAPQSRYGSPFGLEATSGPK